MISRPRGWLPVGMAVGFLLSPLPRSPRPAICSAAFWVSQRDAPSAGGTNKPDPEESAKQNNPRKEHAKFSPAPGPVECTRFTKTGTVLHVEQMDGQTVRMDKWCQGEIQVTVRPEWSDPLVSVGGGSLDADYLDYSKADFPELAWISEKNYAGMETVQDHACLVFKDRLKAATGEDRQGIAPAPVEVVAYVDYYSRLPVQFSRGDAVYSYRFGLPPAHPLEIPPQIQAAIDERQRHLKDLTRPPAKPY